MAIAGATTTGNIVSQVVSQVVRVVKKKKNSPPPSDCFVLRMHYNYGFYLFGFLFWATFHSWYAKDPLTCVSHFNAEGQVRVDYLNFCMTYIYVPSDDNPEKRRYLFFYRWLHWCMLIIALAYFMIRKFAKSFENKKLRKLLADVIHTTSSYDPSSERGPVEKLVLYLSGHLRSHNPIFLNAVLSVIFALIVDLLSFWFVDYLLQNRFYNYGLMAFNTPRDTINYSDYISRIFPPFAKCTIGVQHMLTAKREETLGCHLGIMEVYEKLFFFVWVYLVVVVLVTIGYLINLAFYFHPYYQQLALKPQRPVLAEDDKDVEKRLEKVLKRCKVGDIYVLKKLKAHLSNTRYYMLLCRLSDPSLADVISHDPTTLKINNRPSKQVVPQGKPGMMGNQGMQAYMMMNRGQKGNMSMVFMTSAGNMSMMFMTSAVDECGQHEHDVHDERGNMSMMFMTSAGNMIMMYMTSADVEYSSGLRRGGTGAPRDKIMGMPGQGGRSFDIIRQIVGNVVNIFNKRPTVCTAPCDGMVLKMHYQWTFWVMLGGFSAIWYSWFHRDVITCASHFNAETQVRLDYINICLSYPYIEVGSDRRYLLFYRWIHWVLLILGALYYIPRKISKNAENPKVKKLFEDLAVGVHRYDNYEREMVDRAARYMAFNIKTHNALFYKYLSCNVIALAIDLFAFHFLDYVFQNRFLKLGFQSYPFNRDPKTFTDYMSQTFPPFADCELGVESQLVNKRTEKLGCHLTVMELYEKIFLALWLWLILLTILTSLYIVYLFFFWSPWARLHILRVSKPVNAKDTVRNTVVSVLQNCKIGDIYLLYRLRQHFSHARYYDLLTKLSDPDFLRMFLDNVSIDHKGGGQQDLRHRNKAPMIKSPGKYDLYTKPNKGILVE
ncbi:uncharacterized protein LOC108665311 [Hyalella azteca]|uniref:Innexin n=1 Tax=Hyalella azteca TaxID=294128 RepID=A0A979FX41_HYAAZ|nr:uncharacterized protein LOC108665311 [Hyalella azteca]